MEIIQDTKTKKVVWATSHLEIIDAGPEEFKVYAVNEDNGFVKFKNDPATYDVYIRPEKGMVLAELSKGYKKLKEKMWQVCSALRLTKPEKNLPIVDTTIVKKFSTKPVEDIPADHLVCYWDISAAWMAKADEIGLLTTDATCQSKKGVEVPSEKLLNIKLARMKENIGKHKFTFFGLDTAGDLDVFENAQLRRYGISLKILEREAREQLKDNPYLLIQWKAYRTIMFSKYGLGTESVKHMKDVLNNCNCSIPNKQKAFTETHPPRLSITMAKQAVSKQVISLLTSFSDIIPYEVATDSVLFSATPETIKKLKELYIRKGIGYYHEDYTGPGTQIRFHPCINNNWQIINKDKIVHEHGIAFKTRLMPDVTDLIRVGSYDITKDLEHFLLKFGQSTNGIFMIEGVAGAGKTTLLKDKIYPLIPKRVPLGFLNATTKNAAFSHEVKATTFDSWACKTGLMDKEELKEHSTHAMTYLITNKRDQLMARIASAYTPDHTFVVDEFQEMTPEYWWFLKALSKTYRVLLAGHKQQAVLPGKAEVDVINQKDIMLRLYLPQSHRCSQSVLRFALQHVANLGGTPEIHYTTKTTGKVIFVDTEKDVPALTPILVKTFKHNHQYTDDHNISTPARLKGETLDSVAVFENELIAFTPNEIYVAATRTQGDLYVIRKQHHDTTKVTQDRRAKLTTAIRQKRLNTPSIEEI